MICPFCQHNDDKVIDSRPTDAGAAIRRRRECIKCGKRFTTFERVEEADRLFVIKRDGTHVPFSRDSILRGVQAACGKRPISEESKQRLVTLVEESIYKDFEREVPSAEVGKRVCERLRALDEVAYIRFASEYHRFKDVGELAAELQSLANRVKDVKDQQKLF
ncbi:MAG: transcriptional regulator NrdR [Phycisphaerales bacterium]|nr:transcriptional regulator NrdR [Phycisphaerales bacterium]